MKQVTRLSISLLLTALFLALFAAGFDLRAATRSLKDASPVLILLSIGVNLVAYVIRAWRWQVLLSPIRRGIGLYGLTSATFIGFMVSFLVPFRVGEVVRPVLLARRERLNAGAAIATIAVERLLDVLAISTFFLVFLMTDRGASLLRAAEADPGADAAMQYLRQAIAGAAVLAGIGIPVLLILVFAPGLVAPRLRRLREKFAGGLLGRLAGLMEGFVAGLGVVRKGGDLVRALALSLGMWLVIDVSLFLGVRAMDLELGFTDILLLVVPLAIGIAVPTPAGVGPYEFLGQIALRGFWGAAAAQAAAATIMLHAIAVVPTILVGLVFMWRDGLGWSEVRRLGRAPAITPRAGPERDAG